MPGPPVVAVDIGGTKTRIAVFDGDDPRELGMRPTAAAPDDMVAWIAAAVAVDAVARNAHSMGVGCPGPLDPTQGVLLSPPSLPGWHGFALADALRTACGLPVAIENDANLGALGEARYGSGRQADPLFYMTISTGIGTGIVAGGRILSGAHGQAGEIWTFNPFAYCGDAVPRERCPRRLRASINDMASGNGLVASARALMQQGMRTGLDPADLSTHSILEAWRARDPLAREVVENARGTIAVSLAFVLLLLDPAVVVLAGGLCTDEAWFVRPVCRRVRALLGDVPQKETPIRRARLWDRAVLFGARALAQDLSERL